MVKAILFDGDGVTFTGKNFTQRYSEEYGIPIEKLLTLFKGDYQNCAIGRADLIETLKPYAALWHWTASVQELLAYWLQEEELNVEIADKIYKERINGVVCYLVGNQEKYRAQYLKDKYNLEQLFDGIILSVDAGFLKPTEEYYEAVYERVRKDKPGIRKDEIILIDDEQKNVDAAGKFGFKGQLYTK